MIILLVNRKIEKMIVPQLDNSAFFCLSEKKLKGKVNFIIEINLNLQNCKETFKTHDSFIDYLTICNITRWI